MKFKLYIFTLLFVALSTNCFAANEQWKWQEIVATQSGFTEYKGSASVSIKNGEISAKLYYEDDGTLRNIVKGTVSHDSATVTVETMETDRDISTLTGTYQNEKYFEVVSVTNGWLTVIITRIE